jgi:O-antigen/teichoic acid export membrane protein
VSTAYFTIAGISILFVCLGWLAGVWVDWAKLFNTSSELGGQLRILLPLLILFFGLQLIVKLIISIFQGDQHHSIQDKFQFATQAILLISVWLLTKSSVSSLLLFGAIFSSLPLMLLIGLNLFAFNGPYKDFKPKMGLFETKHLKEIGGLGIKFFIIQMAAIVLFSTDNFIITRLFSPEEVVPYNVAYKYFSIIIMGYGILIAPFWSSFTEAFAQKDFAWIKTSVTRIQRIWMLIPLVLTAMVFLADWFYGLWLGERVFVPFSLTISMALFALLITFNQVYVSFINGIGKIRLQLYLSVFTMILNIPLSIFFAKGLDWGPTGIILGTNFCLLYSAVLWPIQYKKIIHNTAKGIWGK